MTKRRENNPDVGGGLLDFELAGSVPFRRAFRMEVPDAGGVYLIHDLRGTLYIGRSIQLSRRFNEHYEIAANELLFAARSKPVGPMFFSWILIPDEISQARMERSLVLGLRPPCNRVTPGLFKKGGV